MFFDDLKVTHQKSSIVEAQDFYPFGLTYNKFTRENAVPNRWKFQGQEHIDDLGLNWDSFKWRNHQPDIGRFFNVDPLAEDYYYNSPYAFSENNVTTHIELEGLEAVNAGFLLEQAVKVANTIVDFLSGGGNDGTPEAAAKFGTAMNKPEPISAKAQEMKAEIEGTLGQVPGMNVALNVIDAGQAETTGETLKTKERQH